MSRSLGGSIIRLGQLPAAVLAALLVVSGGAVAATPRPGEARVAAMFAQYRAALLARDFRTACRLTAPETDAALVANLRRAGVVVGGCVEAFRWIYSTTRDGGRTPRLADRVTRTTRVSRITVEGRRATIVWSAELSGRRVTVSNTARLVGRAWQLVDTD